ncbi:MAG: EAL domain-containing protein [Roseibium sp.]
MSNRNSARLNSPTFRGLLAGIATAVISIFVAWAGIAVETQRDLAEKTRTISDTWAIKLASGRVLYPDLEKIPYSDCSEAHLRQLSEFTYKGEYINNIWFFPDGDTRAACSSAFGTWPETVDLGEPNILDVFNNGYVTWFNTPFDKIEGVEHVTLIKKGRYAISYIPTGSLAYADDDLIMLTEADDTSKIIQRLGKNPDLLEQYRSSFGPVFGNVYAKTCANYNGGLCYLTKISAQRVLSENTPLVLLFIVFSLALGWLVYDRTTRSALRRRTPSGRVLSAMKRGGSNFHCHYQPILALDTMEVEGCEVLARFEDAYGPLYPDQFIPIIQETECTWEFTEIILNKARIDLLPCLENRPDFKISVNFFPEDLAGDRILRVKQSPVLANVLDDGFNLCCEVLETGIRQGLSITETLDHLRSLGCLIAIDDFGTGFSNLAQIKELQPDLIKIDKVFVDDLVPNSEVTRNAFLHAILDIARAHNLKVCAEGIETMEQLASLRNHNVHCGQGYFFARPMPVQDFSLYLLKNKVRDRFQPDTLLADFRSAKKDIA